MSDVEIASESAQAYDRPFGNPDWPQFRGLPVGEIGILSSAIPGIASGFAGDGVIYILRLPRNAVVIPEPWQLLEQEMERTIFNSLPPGSIVRVIPARQVAPLMVNENGLLAQGR